MGRLTVGIHADPINHRIPGGIGVYVRRLVEHLMKSEEFKIHLLAAKAVPGDPADWWKAGWWRPARWGSGLPLKLLYASWNYLGVPRVGGKLDLVHATGLVVPPARPARLVATVHDVAVEAMPEVVPATWRRIYARGLEVALGQAEVFCVVSEAVKTQLVELHSVEVGRIVVTPEAPNVTPNDYRDHTALQRLGIDGPYILNVGTVEPRKNQVLLLEAFADAEPSLGGMRLVIAGSAGWGSAETLKTIERLHLEGRVTLTGAIGASALAALYARASIFAMPSLYEGFGIPLVEAMGFGLPCLASHDPALKEVAGDHGAVFLDPKDPAAWSKELVRLVDDEPTRTQLGAAGKSRAAAFSWEKTAATTMDAYRQAAAA